MKSLIQTLPPHHYNLAKALFKLFHTITKHSGENKMTPNSLAIVVGPNVLKSKDDNALITLQDNRHVTRVAEIIIDQYAAIFDEQK